MIVDDQISEIEAKQNEFQTQISVEVDLEMGKWIEAILDFLCQEDWNELTVDELNNLLDKTLKDKGFQEDLVNKTMQGLREIHTDNFARSSYFLHSDITKPLFLIIQESIPTFVRNIITRSRQHLRISNFSLESLEPVMQIVQSSFDDWFGEARRQNIISRWKLLQNTDHRNRN